MKRGIFTPFVAVLAAAWVMAGAAPPAAAQETVPVPELIERSAALSGVEIELVGELVGDYGVRSGGTVWAQLNDDSYAADPVASGGALTGANTGVGIRIPSDVAFELDRPGGYRRVGPVVSAVGVWRHHDPERGGESYLDVSSLTVVRLGRALEEEANPVAYVVGMVLLGLAVVLWASRSRRA